ncbi:flavodoxin family protein [Methanococcoides methylutens]|uniref:Iron-sulfur flavoprotein n=1 Tax=Methanococcoides methylutens MM1 TaxID=1434104 RepID=A0A0E3X1V8_METMT|nr:flavodoxin family protein [Methanococcoides methylutens]AKB85595.1 Iron-sulfur flavoprotein [Methanococcoides methylutens MM1]
MKVVAFNGSPRKEGNTSRLIAHVMEVLEKEGIKTEVVQLGGNSIHGCTACMKCFDKKDNRCVIEKDIINECIEKMMEADGIIIATPTYFADLSPETKALIDRAGFVGKANGELFKRKVGAAVVAVRRAGAIHAFDSINHFFTISEMIIPGSSYWNVGIGLMPGDVDSDGEGMQTMETLGQNMAWLMEKIRD